MNSLGRLAMLPLLKQLAGVMGGGFSGAVGHFEGVATQLAQTTVCGRSSDGLIRVTANAQRVVQNIEIDPKVLKLDKLAIEDLVKSAVNEALVQGAEAEKRAYEAATAKLQADLPGMLAGLMGGGGKKLPN